MPLTWNETALGAHRGAAVAFVYDERNLSDG